MKEGKKYIRFKSKSSLLIPAIVWIFVIIYLVGSRKILWSDGFLTMRVCTVLLLVCTLVVLKRELLFMDEEQYERWKAENNKPVLTEAVKKQIIMFAILVVYMLLLKYLGFLIDTIVFIFAVLFWLGVRNRLQLILIPLLISGILFYVFKYLLFIRLPLGILKNIL